MYVESNNIANLDKVNEIKEVNDLFVIVFFFFFFFFFQGHQQITLLLTVGLCVTMCVFCIDFVCICNIFFYVLCIQLTLVL